MSYVGDFRLGSADFSYGSHSVLGLPIFYTRKSVVSCVGDFVLGLPIFSYGSHSVLGLPIFLYEEVSSIIRR